MSRSDDTSEYRGPSIHAPLAEQLQTALGLDDRPETLGDWVDALATVAEREDLALDVDALCTTDDSDHVARIGGETRRFRCVLDAVVVPFVDEGVDAVEVATVDPVAGEDISIAVSGDGIDVTPEGAVMSFGVARGVTGPPDAGSPIAAYDRFCPYGNAFVSRDSYHEWAADVDAETMATTMDEAHRLAAALGRIAGGR